MRPVRGQRQARVALVADPGVAVVVVPDALQPLGNGGRRGRGQRPAGGGEPGKHRVGMPGVADRDQLRAVRARPTTRLPRARPGHAGVGRRPVQRPVAELQHQVVLLAGVQADHHAQALPGGVGPGAGRARTAGTGPARSGRSRRPRLRVRPRDRRCGRSRRAAPAATRTRARPSQRHDPAQQHDAVRVGRAGQRLPALGDGVADPPAVPDQAARLVVAAPDMPRVGRGHGVAALAADQRRRTPPGCPSAARTARRSRRPGAITAPRSPSPRKAYSRSTRGGQAACAERPVPARPVLPGAVLRGTAPPPRRRRHD